MAPITCQALDKCKEPLVGLHVILECFEGTLMETAMRYTATYNFAIASGQLCPNLYVAVEDLLD